MSDPLLALRTLRDVDVPADARARVRARVEDRLDRAAVMPHLRWRRWALLGACTGAVALLVLVLVPTRHRATTIVTAGQHVELDLAHGHASVHGPAEIAVETDRLALVRGTVAARGELRVAGPSCDVTVHGEAEIAVAGPQLTVRVFAGSVEVVPPVVTCEVIDLPAPPTPPPPSPPTSKVAAAAELPLPSPPTPRVPASSSPARAAIEIAPPRAPEPPPSDPLAESVAAYRAAAAVEANDLAGARTAWQAWRARWPQSPLAQSVDLHLLGVLDKLGRHGEASDLAREFVQRYPDSPRRAEVARMIVGRP